MSNLEEREQSIWITRISRHDTRKYAKQDAKSPGHDTIWVTTYTQHLVKSVEVLNWTSVDSETISQMSKNK